MSSARPSSAPAGQPAPCSSSVLARNISPPIVHTIHRVVVVDPARTELHHRRHRCRDEHERECGCARAAPAVRVAYGQHEECKHERQRPDDARDDFGVSGADDMTET
jgi:hypothetical protein